MTNVQVMERLSKILTKVYNAMDEVEDIADNEIQKENAKSYLLSAAMDLDNLGELLDNEAHINGEKSGAV